MHAFELFRDVRTHLPLRWSAGEFDDYLHGVLQNYVDLVVNANPEDQVMSDIQANRFLIKTVVDEFENTVVRFLEAQPARASESLNSAVSQLQPHLQNLYTQEISRHLDNLYRIRVADGQSPPSIRSEMFHIPFEFRHKVGPQRYSMTGIPCLYLGGSVFLCWHELDTPQFDQVYISRFRLSSTFALIGPV